MGVYGRALMKTSPRYRLRVMEAALAAIDKQLDRVPNDDLTDPILTIMSVVGAWREGVIVDA